MTQLAFDPRHTVSDEPEDDARPLTLDDGPNLIPLLERAAEKKPDNIRIQAGLALAQLSKGDFKRGWKQFDYQLKADKGSYYDDFPVPRWDGQSIAGKHVLVWLDHGIGDQILTAGILPDLIKTAGSVTLLCSRRLVPLFRRSFPEIVVYKVGEAVPARLKKWDFDCQLSLADLGQIFRPSPEFKTPAYLKPDLSKVRSFRDRYGEDGKRIIGLSWWSRNVQTGTGKSMEMTALEPILKWPNAKFVSLQYGSVEDEVAEVKARLGVDVLIDTTFNQFTDIDTFAAQVAAMDGVVTTSNTTAHMAGALGVPTKALIPSGLGRFWYWHEVRSDSPWYVSLDLYRQVERGDWSVAVENIAGRDDFAPRDFGGLPEPYVDPRDPKDRRIADLEDALAEFAVFAGADDVTMDTMFAAASPDEPRIAAFKRDTRFRDMSMFYRAAELTRGLR